MGALDLEQFVMVGIDDNFVKAFVKYNSGKRVLSIDKEGKQKSCVLSEISRTVPVEVDRFGEAISEISEYSKEPTITASGHITDNMSYSNALLHEDARTVIVNESLFGGLDTLIFALYNNIISQVVVAYNENKSDISLDGFETKIKDALQNISESEGLKQELPDFINDMINNLSKEEIVKIILRECTELNRSMAERSEMYKDISKDEISIIIKERVASNIIDKNVNIDKKFIAQLVNMEFISLDISMVFNSLRHKMETAAKLRTHDSLKESGQERDTKVIELQGKNGNEDHSSVSWRPITLLISDKPTKGIADKVDVNKEHLKLEIIIEFLSERGFDLPIPTIINTVSNENGKNKKDVEKLSRIVEAATMLFDPVEKDSKHSVNASMRNIISLFSLLDVDGRTTNHCLRVTNLVEHLCKKGKMSKAFTRYCAIGAVSHDAGKFLNLESTNEDRFVGEARAFNTKDIFSPALQVNSTSATQSAFNDSIRKHADRGGKDIDWIAQRCNGQGKEVLIYAKGIALLHHEYYKGEVGYSIDGKSTFQLADLESDKFYEEKFLNNKNGKEELIKFVQPLMIPSIDLSEMTVKEIISIVKDIAKAAQFVEICDCFDAIVSKRNYNKNYTVEEAMMSIARDSGIQLNQGIEDKEIIQGNQDWAISDELDFKIVQSGNNEQVRKFNPEIAKIFLEMIKEEVLEYKQGGKPEFMIFEDKLSTEDGREIEEFSVHGPQSYVSSIGGINFEQHLNREAINLTEKLKNSTFSMFVRQVLGFIHDDKQFKQAFGKVKAKRDTLPRSNIIYEQNGLTKRFAGIDYEGR